MARLTGLEPATPGVTGRYSNQLSYNRTLTFPRLIARRGERGFTQPARARQAGYAKNIARKVQDVLIGLKGQGG